MSKIPSLGQIGSGFVGGAVANAFLHYTDVKVFDIDPTRSGHSYVDVINQDVLSISLPTPMKKNGEVDCSIVEEALQKIEQNISQETLKPVILKSTIPPAQLGNLMLKHAEKLLIIFNPEFLTERSARYEYIQSNRFIFGTLKEFNETPEAKMVVDLFNHRFPAVPQYWVPFSTASLVKYFTNVFFMSKVVLFNEFAQVAESWGLDFNEVVSLVMMDPRIGRSHYSSPGHDGKRGAAGHCLEKSTQILTNNGYRTIDTLKVGDNVFDGNKFTKITGINTRTVPNYISLNIRGINLKGTEDHIHMVYDNEGQLKEKLFKNITLNDKVFVPIPDIQYSSKNNVFSMPVKDNTNTKWWPSSVEIDSKLARVLGLYLAEGFCGKYWSKKGKKYEYKVEWCFGFDEEHFADEVVDVLQNLGLNTNKSFKVSEKATYGVSRTWVVRVKSKGFYTFIHDVLKLGEGAHTKDTPLFTGENGRALIGGWLDGDGSYNASTISGFSRSTKLVFKMLTMCMDQGIFPALSNKGQQLNISMREDVEKICLWTKRFKFNSEKYVRNFPYESPTIRRIDNGWKTSVSKIERIAEPLEVVSIETESELYTANNILTHNCFIKDIQGYKGIAQESGVNPTIANAVWNKNIEVRGVVELMEEMNKMFGRASSDKLTVNDIIDLGK